MLYILKLENEAVLYFGNPPLFSIIRVTKSVIGISGTSKQSLVTAN